MSGQTRRAVATDAAQPLDANTVAKFQVGALTTRAHLHDLANTLMTTDLVGLCGVRQGGPAIGHDAEIRMADSGMGALNILISFQMRRQAAIDCHLQVDEDLAGSRFGHVKIDDLGRDLAGLVVDACLVSAW